MEDAGDSLGLMDNLRALTDPDLEQGLVEQEIEQGATFAQAQAGARGAGLEEEEEAMEEEEEEGLEEEELGLDGNVRPRSERAGRKRRRASAGADTTGDARATKRTRQRRSVAPGKPYSELTLEELMSLSVRRERKSKPTGDAEKDEEEREKEEAAEEEERRRREREIMEETLESSVGSAPAPPPADMSGMAGAAPEATAEGQGEENNSLDDEMILVNGRIEIREREEKGSGGYSPPQERQGGRYRRKPRASADRWTQDDTREFYRGLRMYGTDFTAIAMLLPNRSRAQVKNKYKKEERENPSFIDFALMNPTDEDAPMPEL